MSETTARQIVIAALIFTAILTGIFTMIGSSIPDETGDYGTYNATFNKFTSMNTAANVVSGRMDNATPSEGQEGIITGLWETSFGAMQSAWTALDILTNMINKMSVGGLSLNLPTWFTGMIVSIILLTFAFALIAAIRQWHV